MAEQLTTETAETPELNSAVRTESIQSTFRRVAELQGQIDAMMAEHVQPLKDDLKEVWRLCKANNDLPIQALKAHYKLYALANQDFEDMVEQQKLRDDMREIFEALQEGGQLDWLELGAS